MQLTPEEIKALKRGEQPRIVRESKPDIEPGKEIEITKSIFVTLRGRRRAKEGGWVVQYRLRDDRPRLPRRGVPVFEPPALNEHGEPIEPSADAIEAARLDGSYTDSRHNALEDVAGVDDETLRRFTVEGRKRYAEYQKSNRAEETARDDVKRFYAHLKSTAVALHRQGVDPAPMLARWRQELAEAERDAGVREAA